MKIKVGQIWKHYKGHNCKIIGIGRHSETLEELVFYIQLGINYKFGQNSVWARPLEMWKEEIYFEGKKTKRFEIIDK